MGSVFRQAGRKTWMLKFYQDGEAVFESSGTRDHAEAKRLLKVKEGKVGEGQPVKQMSGKRNAFTFAMGVEALRNDYLIKKKKSWGTTAYRIRLHLEPTFGERLLSTITADEVNAHTAKRLDAGAARATIKAELAALRRMFTLAQIANRITHAPRYIIPDTAGTARQGFFERERFDAIAKHLADWLRAPATFAYFTGWRVQSEVAPLEWRQVDQRARVVKLDPGTTKNNEGRTFPYDVLPELAALIEQQLRVAAALKAKGIISPYVFPRPDGSALVERKRSIGKKDWPTGPDAPPVPTKWVLRKECYTDWNDARRIAGQPGSIQHDFRRTAVRNLVRAGVPEKMAMQLTGHKTRAVFDNYDIVNEADLRHAVSKLAAAQPVVRHHRKKG